MEDRAVNRAQECRRSASSAPQGARHAREVSADPEQANNQGAVSQ